MLGRRALIAAATASVAAAQMSTTIYAADDGRIAYSPGWVISDDVSALGQATAFTNISGLRLDVKVPEASEWRTVAIELTRSSGLDHHLQQRRSRRRPCHSRWRGR